MSDIDDLNALAKEFNNKNANLLTVQFLRYHPDYRGGYWGTVGGEEQDFSGFMDYVNSHKASLNSLQENRLYYYDEYYGRMDLTHLFATLNGLMYTSFVDFLADDMINDLCGWAGDLQTLVMEVLQKTNYADDYQETYETFMDKMGKDDSYFSKADLYADLDAIYTGDHLSSSYLIGTQLNYYYNSNLQDGRYVYFVDGRTEEQLKEDVIKYTRFKYVFITWPLYDGKISNITETQAQACADAFVDYVFEQIQ